MEWNVRVSGARNPDVIEKINAVFASYWESGDFIPYEAEQFRTKPRGHGSHAMTSAAQSRRGPPRTVPGTTA